LPVGTFSTLNVVNNPNNLTVTPQYHSVDLTITGPATHFGINTSSSATVGTALPVTVTALDLFNNPATSYTGTVHFTSSDGQAVLPADSPLTNGTGTFR